MKNQKKNLFFPSFERWPYFLILSLFFNFSLIFTFLTPFPLVMLLYFCGSKKSIAPLSLGLILSGAFSYFTAGSYISLLQYLFSLLVASSIYFIIKKKLSLLRSFFLLGHLVFAVVLLPSLYFNAMEEGGIRGLISEQMNKITSEVEKNKTAILEGQGEQAREMMDLLTNSSGELVNQLAQTYYFYLYAFVFLFLWWNFVLIFKSLHSFLRHHYPYSYRELLYFKVSEYFIWPTLVLLAFYLFGDTFLAKDTLYLVEGLFYCGAIFYFFQGIGVFLELLDHLKIFGMIRTFFMIGSILFGLWKVLPLVGVLDLFLNFKSLLKKVSKKQ